MADSGTAALSASAQPASLRAASGPAANGDQVWTLLREAPDLDTAAAPWLQLQARMIGPDAAGVLLLRNADGQFLPRTTVPADRPADAALLRLANLAIEQRRGVVGLTQSGSGAVAYPVILGADILGAVSVAYSDGEPAQAMRQLQWGVAYLRDRGAQELVADSAAERLRSAAVLDLLGVTLDEEKFQGSALAAVTHLALAFACDRVAVGMFRRGSTKVAAVSHSASFGKQMVLIRRLGAAMDEAIDQRAVIVYPPPADDAAVATAAHKELAEETGSPLLLTIPMLVRDGFAGAVVFERPQGRMFTEGEVDTLAAAVAALGPVLEERRQNDRWIGFKIADAFGSVLRRLFGPAHAGLKATAAALLLLAGFLSFATGTYEVSAKADLQGMVRRAVVAPLDGFIKLAPARAGDRVEEGELLAALDDADLTLERLRWTTERSQRQIEYDRAFAARNRSALAAARAQMDEADAQIRLVDEQLARLQLKAPFPALVTAGDLSQSIGGAVSRGQTLFEVAPLDGYRVNLLVDQSQIGDVMVGQQGSVLFAAVPDEPFAFIVDKITPVAEAREGRTVFRVEGLLSGVPDRLRPGMDGIAKIEIDQRHYVWIWARSFLDWYRLASWQWLR